jgi:hypothetical protein
MEEIEIKGTPETLIQLWKAVLKRDKNIREGQAFMNKLRELDPGMYKIISGTVNDCYYDDKIMHKTLELLQRAYK